MLKTCIISLDIGGTKIHAGLINEAGKILARVRIPTEAKKNKNIILNNIFQATNTLFSEAKTRGLKPQAISLGLAGQVNFKTGVFFGGGNFNKTFRNIKIRKILNKKYHLPIFLDNDARVFTLGESRFGAGKKYKNIIGLTLGTGIGGGIIIEKKLYRGVDNTAGEFGHMIINNNSSQKCSDGFISHSETWASGWAMAKMYQKLTGRLIDAVELEKRFKAKEANAVKVVKIASNNLARLLANLANTLNPEIIILGGGLMKFKSYWQPAVKAAKKQNPFALPLKVRIFRAKLGDDANLLGAYLLAKNLGI